MKLYKASESKVWNAIWLGSFSLVWGTVLALWVYYQFIPLAFRFIEYIDAIFVGIIVLVVSLLLIYGSILVISEIVPEYRPRGK